MGVPLCMQCSDSVSAHGVARVAFTSLNEERVEGFPERNEERVEGRPQPRATVAAPGRFLAAVTLPRLLTNRSTRQFCMSHVESAD